MAVGRRAMRRSEAAARFALHFDLAMARTLSLVGLVHVLFSIAACQRAARQVRSIISHPSPS